MSEEEENERPAVNKPKVRCYQYLKPRVDEINKLGNPGSLWRESFYIREWNHFEFPELSSEELKPRYTAEENTTILYNRLKAVIDYLSAEFILVRKIYIGKSTNLVQRFSSHKDKREKLREFFVLVSLKTFRPADIPDALKEFNANVDILSSLYESLLLAKIREEDEIKCIDNKDDEGGGGKSTKDPKLSHIYAVFSCY